MTKRVAMYEQKGEQGAEVLVIDDEPSVGFALKMILEDSGYRVAVALTGRDGIERARGKKFCLTITDLRLPDMTGFDVINSLCADWPPDNFIIITSHDSDDVLSPARTRGVPVLLKPFTPSAILQLVAATLAGGGRRRADDPTHDLSFGDNPTPSGPVSW